MIPKVIKTEKEYERALAWINEIMDAVRYMPKGGVQIENAD